MQALAERTGSARCWREPSPVHSELLNGPAARSTRPSAARCASSATTSTSPQSPRGDARARGGTKKPCPADRAAAAALAAAGPSAGVLVSLGGDVAVAGHAPAGGWVLQGGEDSRAPIERTKETISIPSGAVATSSTTVRRWIRGEVVLHHILDPRSGLPASGPWRTASTVARTCVDANLAATAAIVKGESAVAWLEAGGGPARAGGEDGDIRRIGGWPEAVTR